MKSFAAAVLLFVSGMAQPEFYDFQDAQVV